MAVALAYTTARNIYICRAWGGMDRCRCKKGECDVAVPVFCCTLTSSVFHGPGVSPPSRAVQTLPRGKTSCKKGVMCTMLCLLHCCLRMSKTTDRQRLGFGGEPADLVHFWCALRLICGRQVTFKKLQPWGYFERVGVVVPCV